jgi:high-affinity iron transporter
MLGALIIVLRETIEAALLIGVIAAATRSIGGRGRWIGGGMLAGAAGACIVAALTGHIAALFEGVGQELFNASVLGIAVVLLGSHNIWMSAHGAELAAGARRVGQEVTDGRRELSAVLVIVALAVLREGSESVLFLYGLMSGENASAAAVLGGGVLGLLAGALLGLLMYAGMLRIPLRWFFMVTSVLILLLAAGMASRMASFLIQADVLPGLASPAWDTSATLPADSTLGGLLHALIGYEAAPAGMQVTFYVFTVFIIAAGMWWVQRKSTSTT